MHHEDEGRGADWLLAPFNREEDMSNDRKANFEVEAGPGWTQAGCLAAFALSGLFVLGLCWIGAGLVR